MSVFRYVYAIFLSLVAVVSLPTLASAQKNVSINWSYDSVAAGVAGFRLYNNNVFLCETTDPLARQLTCPVDLAVGLNSFTLTSFDVNRMESAQSNAFKYTYVPSTTSTPPTASPLALSTQEDSVLTGLLKGRGPDGQPITYIINKNPSHGRVDLLNSVSGSFVYTPNTNVNGIDAFTYVVTDGVGTSGPAAVTITINPANHPPVAVADNTQTKEDTPVVISVLANDSDVDGNTLTVVAASGASHGTTTIIGNTIRYLPAPNYNGNDTFTYNVSDGFLTVSAPVNIAIASVNDAPVVQNMILSTSEDKAISGKPIASDPENSSLRYTFITLPTLGTATLDATSGFFLYTPKANVSGIETFSFKVNDGQLYSNVATVSITINPVNDPPVAVVNYAQTKEDTPVVISVLTNDTDIEGNPLTVVAARGASHGTTVIIGNTIRYSPAPNYYGKDTFTYDVSDGLLTASSSVNITIASVNDAPIAQNMTMSTSEGTSLSGKLTASDPEHGSLRYLLMTLPARGALSLNSTNGTFLYTPKVKVNGTDTFSFKVNDGLLYSDIATVSITIVPVNHSPMADAGPDQTVSEGNRVQLDASNSFDQDGDIVSYAWTQIDGPAAILSDPNAIKPYFESFDLKSGTVSLTFKLTVTDQEGLTDQDISIVNITWVNEPPVANAGPDQTVFEGDVVSLDGTLSQDPDDGIASYFWEQISGTLITMNNAYNPLPTFTAPATTNMQDMSITLRLTVTDVSGLRAQDTVIVNVSWTNNPPVANAGSDQNVYSGQTVLLDASSSQDSDDGLQSVRWTQTAGLPVTLSDPTAYKPTFAASVTPGGGTPITLTFQVLTTDFSGLQSADSINVVVFPIKQ